MSFCHVYSYLTPWTTFFQQIANPLARPCRTSIRKGTRKEAIYMDLPPAIGVQNKTSKGNFVRELEKRCRLASTSTIFL
ncbi:unnamed protein product [Citrullus colocynthis]|uniref:Uncharacterized protein n=1 Tax=Citrullus colocynthis TaxID=252529 RepID=A0ABP0YLS6_9ROSI